MEVLTMQGRLARVAMGVCNLGQALFFNPMQTFLIFLCADVLYFEAESHGPPRQCEAQ